jgi:hypothetical protein
VNSHTNFTYSFPTLKIILIPFTNAFAPATMLAKRVNALDKEVDAAVLLIGPGGTVL